MATSLLLTCCHGYARTGATALARRGPAQEPFPHCQSNHAVVDRRQKAEPQGRNESARSRFAGFLKLASNQTLDRRRELLDLLSAVTRLDGISDAVLHVVFEE